jgi:hypothetical protein
MSAGQLVRLSASQQVLQIRTSPSQSA